MPRYIYVGMNNKKAFLIIWLFFSLPLAAWAKEPPNIGDLKQQINEYKRIGAYDRDKKVWREPLLKALVAK